MPDRGEIDEASRALFDAAGPGGELGWVGRDPVTGERGLVVAVRGSAVDEVLEAVRNRRPSLFRRLARSFAAPTDDD